MSDKEASIHHEGKLISVIMKELVQKKCDVVGVDILAVEIFKISFSSEMAQSLLLTQQAAAKIDARTLIVEGAVQIVQGALENLEARGINLSEKSKTDLVRKLMVITCSDTEKANMVHSV